MTKLWSCTIKAWIYQKAYKLFSEGKKPVQAAAIELNLREKQVNKFWKLKHMDKLHQLVSRFKNGNRTYLEIKSVAEQIINKLLVEQGALLTSAIMAVVQALREKKLKF